MPPISYTVQFSSFDEFGLQSIVMYAMLLM